MLRWLGLAGLCWASRWACWRRRANAGTLFRQERFLRQAKGKDGDLTPSSKIYFSPTVCLLIAPAVRPQVEVLNLAGRNPGGVLTRCCLWVFFSSWTLAVSHTDIYIYMYAFSRRFYPKRLTIAFRLYIFCQYMCSLGIEPTTFCAANTMLYHWATQEHKTWMIWSLISIDFGFICYVFWDVSSAIVRWSLGDFSHDFFFYLWIWILSNHVFVCLFVYGMKIIFIS